MEYLSAKAILDIAADKFLREEIDCLCLVAPFGRHRRWANLAVPRHLNSAIPVAKQIWKPRGDLDPRVVRRSTDRTLRILTAPIRNLRGAFTDVLKFLRSDYSMLVVDESEGFRPRTRAPVRAGLKAMLSEEASVRIVSNIPIDLGVDEAPLAYCKKCSEPILKGWKGWPHKDPVPLLPILDINGCDYCRSATVDEIPSHYIAWGIAQSAHSTGLPDYFYLQANDPDVEWHDSLIQGGRPYFSEGPCPKCGGRATLTEFSARTTYSCANCGVVGAQ